MNSKLIEREIDLAPNLPLSTGEFRTFTSNLFDNDLDIRRNAIQQIERERNATQKLMDDHIHKLDFHHFDIGLSSGKNKKKNYLKFFKKSNNNLYLKDDLVQITENLLIPSNFNVIIDSGQKLILLNNSFIISHSPWIVDGKKKEIVISGLENDLGGGIMISNSSKQSYFNNVKFSHLGGLETNNELTISGAINFYKTDVLMKKKW